MATIKAQELYDVSDPDFDPDDGDQYDKQLFNEKQSLFTLFWLLPFRQTKEENWSRSLKEIEEPSFPSFTTSILSPTQYEIVTLTTYITNLSLTDNWMVLHISFSVISKRNFICWIVLSLAEARFQKQLG